MSYTATKLITNAYYLSGIVGREFETVSGTQSSVGLENLNEILADKTVDFGMIPYITSDTFTAVVGQEEYTISDLIEVKTLTFIKDEVRYHMEEVKRDAYFGSYRAEGIDSLPYYFHQEPTFGGTNIFMYFLPDDTYEFTIYGKFRLSSVTLAQDLSLTIDQFYIDYLKYELAERLCEIWNYPTPEHIKVRVMKYRMAISKRSAPIDTQTRIISTLSNQGDLSYAQVNLGGGWAPPR